MTGFPDSITGTTLDSATRAAIFKSLKSVSRRSARPCLDAVLRQLASAIDALERGERLLSPLAAAAASAATVSETQIGGGYAASDEHAFNKITEGDGVSSVDRFSDSNVPYPRTSGATFAGNGHIVCFTMLNQNLSLTASSSSSSRKTTPRSYSAYSAPAFPTHRRSPGSSTQSTLQSSTTTGYAIYYRVLQHHSNPLRNTEWGVLSVARFCYVFPCDLQGPARAVGSYSISQSAGGTSKNIIFKT